VLVLRIAKVHLSIESIAVSQSKDTGTDRIVESCTSISSQNFVWSAPMDPHQLRAYRLPQGVRHHNIGGEEEDWSATSSEGEERQNETAPVRRKIPINGEINIIPSRHRKRVTQQHHRDHSLPPLQLGYNNEDYGGQSIPSGRDRPPRPGGDMYHLPQPSSRNSNPFAPLNRQPPQATQPQFNASHEYPMNQPPPAGYPRNHPFGSPPPLYQHPHTPPYFPGQGGLPPNHHGGDYYPASPYPENIYPVNHGPPGPSPYANPPPIVPLYDEMPYRQAHVVDPKVERLERQLRNMEIREREREEQQREEEAIRRRQDAEERALRRERKRIKEQEKLILQTEVQRREMEARIIAQRQPVDQGIHDEISGKKIEKEVRAAMEYIAAGRPNRETAGRRDGLQDAEIEDTGDILVAIKEFVEQRLQRQERLGFEERSMKSARSARSVGTHFESRRGNRLEIVPYEREVDTVTRTQIEDIVIDVLQRVGVRGQIQETASAWDKSTFLSGRQGQDNRSPTPLRSPKYEHDPRYGAELETRPGPGRQVSYENRQSDPMTPDSQGQFSGQTAVDTRSQYRRMDMDGDIRLRKPPGPRNEPERKRESNPPTLRVRTVAPPNDYFQDLHDQSAEEEYRPVDKRNGNQNGGGNDMIRRRTEKEPKRRRRRDPIVPETDDESDDMYPRRPGPYAGKPPRGSRQHRVGIPPPTVPDAPRGESNSKSALHKASVVTDAEEAY
jgi:hypothetical protein